MSQCTCTKDKEVTCIVHPTPRHLKERIAELEAENKELRKMIDDYDALQVKANDLASKQNKTIVGDREAMREVVATNKPGKLGALYRAIDNMAKRLEEEKK